MEIKLDTTESNLLKGLYKTAYSPCEHKFVAILKAWVSNDQLLIAGRLENDRKVYFFNVSDLVNYCF